MKLLAKKNIEIGNGRNPNKNGLLRLERLKIPSVGKQKLGENKWKYLYIVVIVVYCVAYFVLWLYNVLIGGR